MIKILATAQIKAADEYTILQEPVSSIQLMERAARAFTAQFILDFPNKKKPILVLCGNGNNGGDGLAIARLLLQQKYTVTIFIFQATKYSADFTKNLKQLKAKYKKNIHEIHSTDFINNLSADTILIDAIFGTGLNAPLQKNSIQYQVIEKLNTLHFKNIIAVDIPSGLFADKHTDSIAIQATKTYTFQFPKLAFLLPENARYVNDFVILNIGLHPDFIAAAKTDYFYLTQQDVKEKLHTRKKYAHKGTFGHALINAGSYGKIGAAILCSKACLRSGCGLVSVHIPACGYTIMQTAFPEAMCSTDKNASYLTSFSTEEKYAAIAIGPGLGAHPATIKAIEGFLKNYQKPVVLDADALNILAKKKTILKLLPENTILTPHPKEFERLAGKWKNDFERLSLQQNFSKKYKVIVVLKGAHTSISDKNGRIYFNTSGNPGMATGGSGDVLTGIITGLLAQGYSAPDSALLGVYLHGLAGDKALIQQSMESLLASDIIENIGNAFKEIEKKGP